MGSFATGMGRKNAKFSTGMGSFATGMGSFATGLGNGLFKVLIINRL